MRNGYKILWTDHALIELAATVTYLDTNFSEKELAKLANEIEKTTRLISTNPFLFSETQTKTGVRRVNVARYNTLYYRIKNDTVEILSFFSNRQNPDNLSL